MALSERTERALEACHDAILAPTRWPSALQSLAESFGAASCTFYEHDREHSPAPVPMSVGHEAFVDLWSRNQGHAPDPHVGPYLKLCTSFIRAGWSSALEHQLSTEEEHRTLPYFRETARPGSREWLAMAFFSIEGGDWCFPIYRGDDRGPFTPEDARRLASVAPYVAKIVSLAQKFAAFDVTSKLSALERVNSAAIVIDATGRAIRMNLPAQVLLGADFNLVRGRPVNGKNWDAAIQTRHTINEIFKPFTGVQMPFPGSGIIENRAIKQNTSNSYATLDIVPASLQLDDIEIDLTASHQANAINSEWDKRTLICRWLEEAAIDQAYDYIIFDCPPATKIVSQNAIAASHGYILPVIPEAVMERGAPHLVGMIHSGIDAKLKAFATVVDATARRPMHVPNTKLVGLVITRIKTHGPAQSGYTDDHTTHLGSLQRRWGNALIKPYIEDGTGISQALAEGLPVYDRATTQNVGGRGIHRMFRDLTTELKRRIDLL